jgi:hypothetical protein
MAYTAPIASLRQYSTIQQVCTANSKDIRVAVLNERYKIIYWSPPACVRQQLWSFQISYIQSDVPLDFNEELDKLLRDEAGIEIISHTPFGSAPFWGCMLAQEGQHVTVKHKNGPLIRDVTFPKRGPQPDMLVLT